MSCPQRAPVSCPALPPAPPASACCRPHRPPSSLWSSGLLGAAQLVLTRGAGGQRAVAPASAVCRPWGRGCTSVCGHGEPQQSQSPSRQASWVPTRCDCPTLANATRQTPATPTWGLPLFLPHACHGHLRAPWDSASPAGTVLPSPPWPLAP